jgi:glycosyltransferase involved in cell wall biosynthesis
MAELCSIIIPTFNHGHYIERSVLSALGQTYPEIEVIVVDDGSTDDTVERVKQFAGKVTYYRKENAGRGAAKNSGLEISQGTYIQFLDADDEISPNKLALQIPILQSNENVSVVYSDCISTMPDGSTGENTSYPLAEGDDQLYLLLRRTLCAVHASVTRRSAIFDVGLLDADPDSQEDWDLWLRLSIKGHRFMYVPGLLAHYDLHGSGTVLDPVIMYRRGLHMLNKFRLGSTIEGLSNEILNEFVFEHSIQLGKRAYNSGWWALARQHFRDAAQIDKKRVKPFVSCIPKSYIHQAIDVVLNRNPNDPLRPQTQ